MTIIFIFTFKIRWGELPLKKDRIELENILKFVIDKNTKNRKFINQIIDEEENLEISTAFEEVINGAKTLSSLSIPMLCLLTCAAYDATESEDIIPTEYFTQSEINQYKSMAYDDVNNESNGLKLPIVFDNVIALDPENYVMVIDTQFLVKMLHNNLIHYDYISQRSAIYLKGKDGDAIPVQDLNMKSVVEISDNMLNGTYLPDTLSLNVYSDDVEPLTYDPKKKKLEIHDGAYITILDGFHRLRGAERALYTNPDLPQKLFLTIRSYDEETSKRYFGQINTVNVVAPERLRELKSERNSDLVVKELQRKSELKEKIASAPAISKVAKHLTTFDLLSYTIDKVFNPKTRLEAKEIAIYLGDFFDYLIGNYYEEFVLKVNNYRKTYSHPLMFAGYITIAKIMQEKDMNFKKVTQVINKINFDDEELQSILTNSRGINNNRNRNKMIDYFKARGELFV